MNPSVYTYISRVNKIIVNKNLFWDISRWPTNMVQKFLDKSKFVSSIRQVIIFAVFI